LTVPFEDLFTKLWKRAGGRADRLKRAAQHVTSETGVDVGLLAQYVAFRVSKEHGIKRWGTATALEAAREAPFETARDVMLNHINLVPLHSDYDVLAGFG